MKKKDNKTKKNFSSILLPVIALLLFGLGIFKCIDSVSMQSLVDSCSKDFDNTSRNQCITEYATMSLIHEESSRNAAIFCFTFSVTLLAVSITRQKS